MKRNYLVILVVLVALGLITWAGVANYRKRKQEEAKLMAIQSMLVQAVPSPAPAGADDAPFKNPLADKQAPAFTLKDTSGKKVSSLTTRAKRSSSISGQRGARRARLRFRGWKSCAINTQARGWKC